MIRDLAPAVPGYFLEQLGYIFIRQKEIQVALNPDASYLDHPGSGILNGVADIVIRTTVNVTGNLNIGWKCRESYFRLL